MSIEENVANIVVPSEEEHFDMYPMDFEEFLFDRKIREAARRYEATGDWTHSWNFVGGCALTAEF